MKKDFYDRSMAVGAMYELKRQGFVFIGLELLDADHPEYPDCLLLHANHYETVIPDIEIDCIDSYYLSQGKFELQGWKYWWVFD